MAAMTLKRKKRVLAIDDEPAMTEWLKILLEHAGYEVRTALIGTRGEELFRTWRPDAVVTDMMLPDVDGIELVRKFSHRPAATASTRTMTMIRRLRVMVALSGLRSRRVQSRVSMQ